MKLPIIILGPICSGKTTISKLLSKRLDLPRYSLDRERWKYYEKDGMDMSKDEEMKKGSFDELINFRKPYDLKVIFHSVKDFNDGIIEFGASHSYWENENHLKTMNIILGEIANKILLMPDKNINKSVEILNNRLYKREKIDDFKAVCEVNAKMISCKSNSKLSSCIIYTENKSHEQVVEEIISSLV